MIKKLSITKKVFLLVAVMFCVYLVLNFSGQILFYGKIYTYSKRQDLIKQVESLAESYSTMSTSEQINEALVNFSKSSDSYVMIMGERGNILYTVSYEMTIKTDTGDTVRVTIDNAVHDKGFTDLNLKTGDSITMEYYRIPTQDVNNLYIPVLIKKGSGVWQMNHEVYSKDVPYNDNFTASRRKTPPREPSANTAFDRAIQMFEQLERNRYSLKMDVSGTIVSITTPDERNFQSSRKMAESAWAAMQWIVNTNGRDRLQTGEIIHYIYQTDNASSKYIVVVKKIEAGGEPQLIFAVNTLKSVDEAVNVMKDSYIIWFTVAIFMAVLMAMLFSNSITRSIVNITQVTTKMKNLDFSQKCAVQSEDEVGRLAANINDMSEKLDNTIRELVSANEKLTSDIEHERKMELERREFVAAVSHELKTPLAIIRAYSEGIADGASGERRDKYLKVIIEETEKMDALVLDMLENSRLESGAYKLKIKSYDIAEMTDRIVDRFRAGSEDKDVKFLTNTPEHAVSADFDMDMMEQVMNNFISNAIRHTPSGGQIRVCLNDDAGFAVFSVENEGKPIADDVLPRVWDRFYKADKSRGRSSGGTGLGLSIAKNILLLHKAQYGAENTETGVKFWFKLKKNV